ncbi:P-loop containing nucleoside triphosphate hydrolase protein [Pluteus cervinus]|uniref:P-loop containing nucleoside triphosphate hydrolase protein n=1 Tax=Pluteus cervinus TaxID=181527 RepID=A0ACD3A110_9AGAR|nr:P-loop containing nucleoside triphosphate hydrolase protein [Pluteus cervinus]
MSSTSTPAKRTWSIKEIRDLVYKHFKKRACWMQIQAALAIHDGLDAITCAATGSGKTLSFWMPVLMAKDEGRDVMSLLVTPINLLGQQNAGTLEKAGLRAIAVSAENANEKTFEDIEAGKYDIVIINPELIMSDAMTSLLRKEAVYSRILSIIFDEGHCVSQWARFRQEYKYLGLLRFILAPSIPFYVASATFPPDVLAEVKTTLRLRDGKTKCIMRSNDRADIRLGVRVMKSPATSMKDLEFLIPLGTSRTCAPPKFVVFFDNIKEAEKATRRIRELLPPELRHKLKWFHAAMTPQYREETLEAFRKGDIWGIFATDAFGMGMDLPDIKIVVQWKATCDMCTLWQRFGRAARGEGEDGIAILIVENKDTLAAREEKARLAEQRRKNREGIGTLSNTATNGKKRKATDLQDSEAPPAKQQILTSSSGQPLPLPQRADNAETPQPASGLNTASITVKKPAGKTNLKGRTPVVEEGNVLDLFINTSTCRREVSSNFFGNDKTRE